MGLKILYLRTHHGGLHPETPSLIWTSIATKTTAFTPPALRNYIRRKHPEPTKVRQLPQIICFWNQTHPRNCWHGTIPCPSSNKKLLATLSSIGSEQDKATKATNKAANYLMDYLATYPNYVISYISSNMVLSTHSDASYPNKFRAHSRAGSHIL